MYFTNNDGSQDSFVYQPTLDLLELKKDKGIDYFFSHRSKGVYNSKFKPLYTAFLHSIKLSKYKIRKKFDKDPLAVEQNNNLTKTVNVYIFYELYDQPQFPLKDFTLKNCLFGVTNAVKIGGKDKQVFSGYVYSGYGIAFDGKGERSFGNCIARNVINFGVDKN